MMIKIKGNYVVKKQNILNEIRSNGMNLQELRFFSIYLSKINPIDISTRTVRFSLDDFRSIMDLGRVNIKYMQQVTNSLLCKVVNIPNERGGYNGFQIFKECTVDIDKNSGEWYVEIDAHDKALPLLFEFKEKYFSYQLWNALRLKSSNQLRMYEILKQYEKIGSRVLTIVELKELLGIDKDEYSRFNNLKIRVLDACQQSLKENSDIKFRYEPYGKLGNGGKILAFKFTITKNENYIDKLMLDKFIEQNNKPDQEVSLYDEKMILLSQACNDEFSIKEIVVLHDLMLENLPFEFISNKINFFNHLTRKYNEMNMRNEKNEIEHRFSYLKSIVGKE